LKKRKIMGKGSAVSDHWQNVLREIAIMKKIDHPNVVRLVEVMDDQRKDKLYLIMELVERGSLMDGDSLECEPFPEPLARAYFRDLIIGLDYLHRNHIVHRDIKPENLLLCSDGRIKIGDFGVSHLFEGDDDVVANTAGSAAFMAPEMCKDAGKGSFSGKMTDIWSCGVTLFMFIFGKLPFMDECVYTIYTRIVEDPLEFPHEINSDLRDLLVRMLDKNPVTRITMAQIRSHPWVTNHGSDPLPIPEPSLSASSSCATAPARPSMRSPSHSRHETSQSRSSISTVGELSIESKTQAARPARVEVMEAVDVEEDGEMEPEGSEQPVSAQEMKEAITLVRKVVLLVKLKGRMHRVSQKIKLKKTSTSQSQKGRSSAV